MISPSPVIFFAWLMTSLTHSQGMGMSPTSSPTQAHQIRRLGGSEAKDSDRAQFWQTADYDPAAVKARVVKEVDKRKL